MENGIFRKSSLERISSPEQLNEYIRVTNPRFWVVLGGLFALATAAVLWLFTGTVPLSVGVEGVAFSDGDQTAVYVYLPLSATKRMEVGMEAQISPDYAPRGEAGYIRGRVAAIGDEPVDEAALAAFYGNPDYVHGLLPEGIFYEVAILPGRTGGGFHWSNEKSVGIGLEKGARCAVEIILRERKPWQILFAR